MCLINPSQSWVNQPERRRGTPMLDLHLRDQSLYVFQVWRTIAPIRPPKSPHLKASKPYEISGVGGVCRGSSSRPAHA